MVEIMQRCAYCKVDTSGRHEYNCPCKIAEEYNPGIMPNQPTKHAELCPVCLGKGKVYAAYNTTLSDPTETCHSCGGCGWVAVPN